MTFPWLTLVALSVAASLGLMVFLLTYPRTWLPVAAKDRSSHAAILGWRVPASLMGDTATLPLKHRLLIGGGCFLPLAMLAAYLEAAWLIVPALGLFLAAPEVYLAYVSARDTARKESQIPHVVESLCRALRAGHNLYHSLAQAAREVGPPLDRDLRAALDRFSVAGDMAAALNEVREGTSSRRLGALLDVLIFDLEEGVAGTAGEVERLETLLESMRQEDAMRRELATKTAGTRFNLRLVSLTIPGTVLLVVATDGSLLTPLLTHPLGNVSLALSVFAYLGTLYLSHKWSKVQL